MPFVAAVLAIQVATFIALGVKFLALGQIRLGLAQLLLAAVQGIVYSGGFKV